MRQIQIEVGTEGRIEAGGEIRCEVLIEVRLIEIRWIEILRIATGLPGIRRIEVRLIEIMPPGTGLIDTCLSEAGWFRRERCRLLRMLAAGGRWRRGDGNDFRQQRNAIVGRGMVHARGRCITRRRSG